MEIYLATSVFESKGYDSLLTINEAATNKYQGVQLYINESFQDVSYLQEVIGLLLQQRQLGILIHLPNEPKDEDLTVTTEIYEALPRTRALIHFDPADRLPKIPVKIGWENSDSSRHNPQHIDDVQKMAVIDRTFFVYDYGRSYKAEDNDYNEQSRIVRFISQRIRSMDPNKDVLHAAEKTRWNVSFRENQCPIGEGVGKSLLHELKEFAGPIVLEYEDLAIAHKSRDILSSGFKAK